MKNPVKLSIALLIGLVGFPQISETIYTPALPNVAAGLQTSAHLVEASLAVYFLGFAVGVSLWGAVSDWCGRRMAMLSGLFIYGCATLACAQVDGIEALLFWRFLQAFGAAVGSVITQTILRDAYEGPQRAQLFSVMSGALAFSPAIGPLLGGFISQYWGWRANFLMLTAMAVVLFIWSLRTLPETRPRQQVPTAPFRIHELFKQMIGSPNLWGHILLIGATNGMLFSFYQEAPFIFIEQLRMQPSHYGLVGLLIAAATIVAARLSFKMSGQLSPEALIVRGAITAMAGSLLFLAMAGSDLFSFDMVGMVVGLAALFIMFLGIGLIIPNSLSLALKPYQQGIGTAGSIFGGLYYCLIAAFTSLMSVLHDGSLLPLPLYMVALATLLLLGGRMVSAPRQEGFRA